MIQLNGKEIKYDKFSGDGITYERAEQIFNRLHEKGFASTNVVFGK